MSLAAAATYPILTEHPLLGPTKTADFAWQDTFGCMVFAYPRSAVTSRRTGWSLYAGASKASRMLGLNSGPRSCVARAQVLIRR